MSNFDKSAVTCRRRDPVFAAYVDAAITIQKQIGTRKAEEFLAREGVPTSVAMRVLRGDNSSRARHSQSADDKN